MKKIILALACAVSVVVAKASDSAWFSGSASGTGLTATNATWSPLPVSGVEVAEGVITLDDLGYDAALTLTPDANKAPDTATKTSVNVTANFYPNAFEDLERPTNAQTALAVAYTTDKSALSYYAWNGSDWVALSGATPVEGAPEVTAKIELDYYRSDEAKARFTIGSTVLTCTNETDQTWLTLTTNSCAVSSVEFAGSGKLRSVASTVELGVASVDGVKYPTYAAAIEAAKVNGVLNKVVTILRESAGETLGADALADYKVADGKIVAKVYVAKIGDTKYETLAEAVAAYTTGDIEVLVETPGDIPAGWKIENSKLIQAGIAVASTDAVTLVAVPADCKADGLIDLSNRSKGDMLQVNNPTGSYWNWELDENDDVGLYWKKATRVSTDTEVDDTPEALACELKAGDAVWVTRQDVEKPIILTATYATADATIAVAVTTGWKLVAPLPKAEAFDLSALKVANAGSFSEKDMIVIPGAAAPINCVRKDNAWKVYTPTVADGTNAPEGWGKIATGATWEDAPKIPAGKGFFFVSDGEKTLEL